MKLFGLLLLFPFLAASPEEDLVSIIEGYRERSASASAAALLRLRTASTPVEDSIVRLLVANDLAALGLDQASLDTFRDLVRHPRLGGAAFVGLARLRDERRESSTLRFEAGRAPWEWMEPEDVTEAAFRVARACIATEHFAEARDWLARVAPESPTAPYATYLRVQAEYGLGNYGRAVEAARTIFDLAETTPAIAALRDRTAVLLGDMFVEIGLYDYAIDLFSWPEPTSPFRARAERDRALAKGLAAIAGGELGPGDHELELVDDALEDAADQIEMSVDTTEEVVGHAMALTRSWPSPTIAESRRAWAANRAQEALEAARGSGLGRLGTALLESLPPVLAYRLATQPGEPPVPTSVALEAESAGFFAPDPELARLLAAVAIAEEAPAGTGCTADGAALLRARAVEAAIGSDTEPRLDDLRAAVRACRAEAHDDLAGRAHARLYREIPVDARRRQRAIRDQRYRIDDAVARFRLDRGEEIQNLRVPK